MSAMPPDPPGRYLRVQATYVGRLGVEVGIFVAVDHLRRAGRLDADELATYLDLDDWFTEHLPEPAFYADGNSIGAVTWWRADAPGDLRERLLPLQQMLSRHGVEHEVVGSDDPGEVVHEDAWQVGVVPRTRREPTPYDGPPLGPTSAGSKRDLPHGPT